MKRTLLIVLVFTGVFICGGVVGGALTFRFGQPFVQKRGADHFMFQQWRELGEKLELTPEQRERVRPILENARNDRQAMQKQMQVVTERMIKELDSVLTPEQRAAYKELQAQQRSKDRQWQRWMREQRERRGGIPPGGTDGKPSGPGDRRERERAPESMPKADGPTAPVPEGKTAP